MSTISPAAFNQEALNRIFTISPRHGDRLLSRESTWLEFKESFEFGSLGKYIRSAAGFANTNTNTNTNTNGGYIVYATRTRPPIIGLRL